jgi:hypothetical protein
VASGQAVVLEPCAVSVAGFVALIASVDGLNPKTLARAIGAGQPFVLRVGLGEAEAASLRDRLSGAGLRAATRSVA